MQKKTRVIDTTRFKDLTGDPVYDYLKTQSLPGFSVIGGELISKKVVSPREPWTTIEILVENDRTKNAQTYIYNYKFLMRKFS